MKTFKINNIDVTNNVLVNTFNYMKRIDDVFGTGSFNFESKDIDYNIPPYSVLTIDNDYFLCNSEATYHFGKQSWFHNVSIIESTSVLSRFLVGSKSFSVTGTNKKDKDKIKILLDLINQKYGVNITFPNLTLNNIFTYEREYVFSAGTTLFDALNEISKNYNYRIFVKSIDGKKIVIDYINLTNLPLETINSNDLLSKTKIQNAENYCKFLESEATNVVDTTNTTIVDNIYPSAGDIKLSEDTYLLKLPTSVFKVKRLWANLSGYLQTFLTYNQVLAESQTVKTYGEWSELYPDLIELYNLYYKKYAPNWELFKSQYWSAYGYDLTPESPHGQIAQTPRIELDLTDRLKSKEQYDLVEDQDKPEYIYYSLGSNIIDGFNVFYKNDFWNTIIGESKKPFVLRIGLESTEYQGLSYGGFTLSQFLVKAPEGKIFKTTYGVEYYPIVNPFLLNTKKDTPDNEVEYKKYALSYGKSSNYVDFDKIYNSMNIENQSMGKVEMVIEIDVTNRDFLYPYRKVNVEGKEWYVSNIQYRITPTQSIGTLNLVQNYNKIADVISLNSQYNTTKNPLQNIIERPIFFETDSTFEFTQGKTLIMIESINKDNLTISNLAFSPIVLKQNDETYLYIQMQDQYSAGTRVINVANKTDVFKVEDVPYVDSNNEVVSYRLRLLNLDKIDYKVAKDLPLPPVDWVNYWENLSGTILVYKDAREKLTFTIKANNCIIK